MALDGAESCVSTNLPAILIEWNVGNLAAFDCDFDWLLRFSNENRYTLFSVPSLAPVGSSEALRAHMALTESFLLLPERKQTRSIAGPGNLRVESNTEIDERPTT